MDKVVSLQQPASIQEEAALWLVRMDEKPLSAKETIELKSWLDRSIRHRQYFREAAYVYHQADVLNVLAELFPIEEQLEQPTQTEYAQPNSDEPKTSSTQPGRPFKGWTVTATFLLVTALLVGNPLKFDQHPQPTFATYSTAVGDQKTIALADGSIVSLNTNTRIQVDYSDNLRKITLERGEAFFEVAKDYERPFTVFAGNGQVTAVGTAFSVYKRADDIEVTVTAGRVIVESEQIPVSAEKLAWHRIPAPKAQPTAPIIDNTGKEVLLRHGQMATFKEEIVQAETIKSESVSQKLLWLQGILAFEAESLDQVITEFSRYTNLNIIIADEELKSIKVDGYFPSDDIPGMLNWLKLNFGTQIIRLDKDTIALSRSKP